MGTPKVPRLFPPSRGVAREGAERGADPPLMLWGTRLVTGGVVVDMVKDDRFFSRTADPRRKPGTLTLV